MNLLVCDPEGRFRVCEDGAACLERLEESFAVGAGLGVERAGKSTMLTWLCDYSVFPSQSGNVGHTKAVWTALKPNAQGILLLDFEGFSHNRVVNRKLFVLAVLLGSVVVYSTDQVILQDMLDKLEYAGKLVESIGGHSHGARPALLWLLKNYSLDKNENQSDYLRRSLAQNGTMGDNVGALFPERACIAVPSPGQEIPPGSRVPPAHMQPAVRTIRAELERLSKSKPLLRGPQFVSLLRSAVDAVNSEALDASLDLGSVWDTMRKAHHESARMQRKMDILQMCRDQLQNKSPAAWELAVQTFLGPEERAEFDDLLDDERQRNRDQWTAKLQKVTTKLQGMLESCADLQALAGFLRDLASYDPPELVDAAIAGLLPVLARKLLASDEETRTKLAQIQQVAEQAAARVAKLDQLLQDKTAQFRTARDELQATLQAQHATELELQARELEHEQTRTRSFETQLKTQGEALARALTEVFESKQQTEDALVESRQLGHALEQERSAHAGLKRKLEDAETAHALESKRLKELGDQQLGAAQAELLELKDQMDHLSEQLEQVTQERERCTTHAAELESSRARLHDDYMRVRSEMLRPAVPSNSEVALKAENEGLKAQLQRLRNRMFSVK